MLRLFSRRSCFVAPRPRIDPPGPQSVPESTRLTFDPGLQTEPTFSPDGRSIAYSSNKSGNYDIWQQPVAGGDAIQVTKDPADDWQPHWSPNGDRIAFRSERGGGGIFVVPTTGGHEERITESGFRPRWSPNGSRSCSGRGGLTVPGHSISFTPRAGRLESSERTKSIQRRPSTGETLTERMVGIQTDGCRSSRNPQALFVF